MSKYLKILIIVITIIVIGGIAAVFSIKDNIQSGNNNTNNTPNINGEVKENETEIDTNDWQVYENKKYGFSLKYPRDTQVGVEFGSQVTEVTNTNEFYVGGLYMIISIREDTQVIDAFIDDKVGNNNFNLLENLENGKIISVKNRKSTAFNIKDGHTLNTVLTENVEMVFIEGSSYFIWVTSKIGTSGDGRLSSKEKAIIKSIKIEN